MYLFERLLRSVPISICWATNGPSASVRQSERTLFCNTSYNLLWPLGVLFEQLQVCWPTLSVGEQPVIRFYCLDCRGAPGKVVLGKSPPSAAHSHAHFPRGGQGTAQAHFNAINIGFDPPTCTYGLQDGPRGPFGCQHRQAVGHRLCYDQAKILSVTR